VFVACIAFFLKQYNDTGNPGKDPVAAGSATPGATDSPSDSPSASASTSDAPGPFKGLKGLPTGYPSTRDKFGRLLVPRIVTMTVTSSEPIFQLGYLVPTSLDSPYGRAGQGARSWSLTVRATGRTPLAAIFIQAGRSGAPVTCTITIDGQAGDTETTTQPWQRQLCVA
jgi:hypothetical protein